MAGAFRVGDWLVEPQLNSISANGSAKHVEPKIMQVLVCLAEHANQVVSKDRLIQSVWTDTFVSDDVLARSIRELRRVFGDDPKEPRFIQTIPKNGYRLIAPVSVDRANPEAVLPERIAGGDETRRVNSRARWLNARVLAACLIVAGMAAVAFYLWVLRKSEGSGGSKPMRSIAVLPFKSVGPEVADEYLGLEIADTLITRLSSTKQLVVCPPGPARKYSDKNQDPIAAGRELSVELVLDGSTQREGERVRVTVRLLKVADGSALLAERYDEKFADIFAVQDNVAEKVARSLALRLTGEERKLLTKRYTENTEAYRLYLMGRYFSDKGTEAGTKKGIEYFDEALKIDPNYALAYSGLADIYNGLAMGGVLLPKEGYLKAKEAALKALAIDNSLAEAHTSLAYLKYWYEYDWLGAEAEYKLAIELNPNLHPSCAAFLWCAGRDDEAIAFVKRSLEFDPTDVGANSNLGEAFFLTHRYDQAIEQCRNTIAMDPNLPDSHFVLGVAYEQKGMYEEAIAEIQKAKTLVENEELHAADAALGHIYAVLGKRDKAHKIIEELKEQSKRRYIHPCFIALVYGGLGEKDQALEWLEKGYEDRSFFMVYLKVDPRLDNLRSDPRFVDLLRRVGLGQ